MYLSDMHFHLDGYPNHQQIYNQINEYKQYTLCVTNSPDIYEACLSTYTESNFVRFALGMHPLQKITEETIVKFQRLAKKARYIGEVGLDFSKASAAMKEHQISVFSSCLSLAGKEKIFSIHSLRAEKQIYEILKCQNSASKYIMHWYCGDIDTLEKLVSIGCYFSINISQLTNYQDIVRAMPKEKILIESDAPIGSYLGKKFTPKDLTRLYDRISCFLGIDAVNQVNSNMRLLLEKR